MKSVALLLLVLFVSGAFSLGTLYLNKIVGNTDPITGESPVYGECIVFDADTITLDFINGLQGDGTGYGAGVFVERTNNNEGSVNIPNHLHVEGYGWVDNVVTANGGIFCDDGGNSPARFDDDSDYGILYYLDDDVFDYSFTVTNNTGVTTVVGTLFPNGGITVGEDLFTVQDNTGRTTVKGLTRPDGGIELNALYEVRTDGYLYNAGNLTVERDFYLGSDRSETRYFQRQFCQSQTAGGKTILHGQDAAKIGGNLVFIPGFGTREFAFHKAGAIYLGDFNEANTYYVTRQDIEFNYHYSEVTEDQPSAGQTIFSGQDSQANGGKLKLRAGRGHNSAGNAQLYRGGDLILETAYNSQLSGTIWLGPKGFSPDYGQRLNFDLFIMRPDVTDAQDAGDTTILGQSILQVGAGGLKGGHLFFTAGDGLFGGGNLYLQPGESSQVSVLSAVEHGEIYLGQDTSRTGTSTEILEVVRNADFTSGGQTSLAGETRFVGQNSINGDGGDLVIVTGGTDATAQIQGSNLFLYTYGQQSQASSSNLIGTIYLDSQPSNALIPDDIFVVRTAIQEEGYPTAIIAQNATNAGNGGAFNLNAGNGQNLGGNFNLMGGHGTGDNGGNVLFTVPFSATTQGGNILVAAGRGSRLGGSVSLWPGNGSPTQTPANLNFFVGNNAIFATATQLHVKVPFVVDQGNDNTNNFLRVTVGTVRVDINAVLMGSNYIFNFQDTAGGGITRNMIHGIRNVLNLSEPTINPYEDYVASAQELYALLVSVIGMLNYHNLLSASPLP